MTLVLKGTWEEIKLHEAELAGKRLRLIVESEGTDEEKHADIQRRLDAWKRLDALAVEGVVVDDTREGIYAQEADRA